MSPSSVRSGRGSNARDRREASGAGLSDAGVGVGSGAGGSSTVLLDGIVTGWAGAGPSGLACELELVLCNL